MRRWRWLLLAAWLVVIASLILPGVNPTTGMRLFWGTFVPGALLLIAVASHEIWRRLCPLAFVSQLGRSLGIQRTRIGRSGRPEVVKVEPDSWLARHHLQLQWSLLMAGLSLRLLLFNHPPSDGPGRTADRHAAGGPVRGLDLRRQGLVSVPLSDGSGADCAHGPARAAGSPGPHGQPQPPDPVDVPHDRCRRPGAEHLRGLPGALHRY